MVRIVKGENATLTIKLRDSEGDPIDLTPYNKFKVCLPTVGSSPLEITETPNTAGSSISVSGNVLLGKLVVNVKAADSETLNAMERQDIDLELNNSVTPNPRRARFKGILNVEQFCH